MNQKLRGFTVIEVILVCAIGGLIFVMAFIALPSLWASQRDADRKALVSEFVSTIKKYQTNNSRGALPTGASQTKPLEIKIKNPGSSGQTDTSWKGLIENYLPKTYRDPESNGDGTSPSDWVWVVECNQTSAGKACGNLNSTENANNTGLSPAVKKTTNDIRYYTYVVTGAKCGDNNRALKSENNRDVAVYYILERGGRYCMDA